MASFKILVISTILVTTTISFATGPGTATFVEDFRFGKQGKGFGEFNNPLALAVSADGVLFVVDSRNNRIQLFKNDGTFIKIVGGFGFEGDQFDLPTDIWVRSLINVYVADYNNQRIQRYDRQMNYIAELSSNPNWPEAFQFGQVLSCALNSQNELFILDHLENKVVKLNRNGQPERYFGLYDSGPGELQDPVQIDIFAEKFIIISDVGRKAVVVFDFFGNFIRLIQNDHFVAPAGLTTDDRFGILLVDEGARTVFHILPDLHTVKPLPMTLQQKLSAPRDIALLRFKDRLRCFLLDGNQVVVGSIVNRP